tara:strand:+ start:200 stop:886 length:687 start_codon:yes stop_codon:yes gene_type:complete
MIYIIPTGGLCNCLRVVFSYNEYAKSINEELTVIWKVTKVCNGFFLDYFEEVPNITFLKSKPDNIKITYTGCGVCKKNGIKDTNYSDLILLPRIKEKINKNIKVLGNNYIAVHIRRTDHTRHFKNRRRLTKDASFIDFIDNTKDCNLYIATDNADSFNIFKSKYSDRVKIESNTYDKNKYRQTTLEDAIIDFYMCIFAKDFKGSYWSSFSTQIIIIRRSYGKTSQNRR